MSSGLGWGWLSLHHFSRAWVLRGLLECPGYLHTTKGRSSANALADKGYNFLRPAPFVVVLVVTYLSDISTSGAGVFYAVLFGAVVSGIGYTIWYVALECLSATETAVTQLTVPAIAAVGGFLLVGERITVRLAIAGGLILGGILLVFMTRCRMVGQAC